MRAVVHPLRGPLKSRGPLAVPGDKSLSHRALLFAALAEGDSRIGGLAPGGDVRSTARCLAQLGVPLVRGDGTPWEGDGPPKRPPGAREPRCDRMTVFSPFTMLFPESRCPADSNSATCRENRTCRRQRWPK